jgi:hypothetical protein
MKHDFRQPGFVFIVGTFGLDLHLHSFELERRLKMSTILIVVLLMFLLGGGGWGYSRWRN